MLRNEKDDKGQFKWSFLTDDYKYIQAEVKQAVIRGYTKNIT